MVNSLLNFVAFSQVVDSRFFRNKIFFEKNSLYLHRQTEMSHEQAKKDRKRLGGKTEKAPIRYGVDA